jgi:hypothetical protein
MAEGTAQRARHVERADTAAGQRGDIREADHFAAGSGEVVDRMGAESIASIHDSSSSYR